MEHRSPDYDVYYLSRQKGYYKFMATIIGSGRYFTCSISRAEYRCTGVPHIWVLGIDGKRFDSALTFESARRRIERAIRHLSSVR